MRTTIYCTILFTLGLFFRVYGQTAGKVDITGATDPFELLMQRADSLSNEPEKSLQLLRDAMAIAKARESDDQLGNACYKLGMFFWKTQELDSSRHYLMKGLSFLQKSPERTRLARSLVYLGLISQSKKNFAEALQFNRQALAVYESMGETTQYGNILSNMGVIYRQLGKPQEAIEVYLRALKAHEEHGNTNGLAMVSGNLGNLYRDQNELDKALNYYSEAARYFSTMGLEKMQAASLNNIGLIYDMQQQKQLALSYYQEALEIFLRIDLLNEAATCYNNIGVIYYNRRDYISAQQNYEEARRIFLQTEDFGNAAKVLSNIGSCRLLLGDYPEALDALQTALAEAEALGVPEIMIECHENLYKYYESLANFEVALFHHKRYSTIRDSLHSLERVELVAEIEARYRLEKKEQENDLLRKNEDIKNAIIQKQELQNRFLAVGAIFLLTFVIYFYRVTQQRRQTNQVLLKQNEEIIRKQQEIIKINIDLKDSQKQLNELNTKLKRLNSSLEAEVQLRTIELQKSNAELDTFLYQSSHALRRPLVQILGLIDLTRMKNSPDEEQVLYEKLATTTSAMDNMLRKLVMASEINVNSEEKEEIIFEKVIADVWRTLRDYYELDNIHLFVSVNVIPVCYLHLDLISFTLYNLLENAVLHGKPHEGKQHKVRVKIENDEHNIICRVVDNGNGIPREAIHQIFRMFTVASTHVKSGGNGLGLYIAHKAAKKMQGDLFLENTDEHGSTFMLVLPLEQTQTIEQTTNDAVLAQS